MAVAPSPVQPTLWRTCRVLANHRRLEILALLLREPGRTVSEVAQAVELPVPTTSEYLRALEARGFLAVRRRRNRVVYRPAGGAIENRVAGLLAAIREVFSRHSEPVEMIFRAVTAFTHPRRIAIFCALARGCQTAPQLRSTTRVSAPSLWRHLEKLQSRSFIDAHAGKYTLRERKDALGRELARLALAG